MNGVSKDRKPCEREFVKFHGYTVFRDGRILGKRPGVNNFLKPFKNPRKGGGFDLRVCLNYNGKPKKWLVHRLVAACFLGPIDGYEINHIDRDTTNNHVDNLERVSASENQKHWRATQNS